VTHRIAIIARPSHSAWRGPLRAWLEQRSRELRDEACVRRVQVVDHNAGDPQGDRSGTGSAWTMVIDFAHPFGADAIIRDVLGDLAVLDASPEVTDLDGAA
jgi:hypothetical protein